MKMTSAAANKLIKKLTDEVETLLRSERQNLSYNYIEGVDATIPDYSYEDTRACVEKLNEDIRKIKHAVNIMNTTTRLPNIGITIDEALVKMAQYNEEARTLDFMRVKKQISQDHRISDGDIIVEYTKTTYDVKKAQEDYKKLMDEVAKIQLDLDYVNQTVTFDVDIDI